jgi:iron(III) transport system permease protein
MAIVIGFLAAWTLTRTRLPGRRWVERLMELPYYMTPLVGWVSFTAPITGRSSGS